MVHYGSHHFGHYVSYRRRPAPPISRTVVLNPPPLKSTAHVPSASPVISPSADTGDSSDSTFNHDSTAPPTPTDSVTSSILPPGLNDGERVEWYRVSDETVEPASIDEVLRSNPFLIFYERIQPLSAAGSIPVTSIAGQAEEGYILARVVQSWNLGNSI